MRQPMSFASQALIAALILLAGAALWVAREPVSSAVAGIFVAANPSAGGTARGSRKRGGAEAVPVVVQTVTSGRSDLEFAGLGTARALRHITIFSAVPGEVRKVLVRAGQRVKAGEKLFELDNRQAELAVAMAASKLEGAKRLLDRADRLRRKKVQSEATVQDATTVADQAEVELNAAKVALGDHVITAPFAGIVGISNIDVGDRITSSTELVTLDDRSVMTVEFDVPERYLPRLRQSMKVTVRTPGFGDRRFEGMLSDIDSRVHPTRRTVAVRASVINISDELRPGMSFAVDMKLPGKEYPRIPDLALQFSQSGNFVWLAKDGLAERVTVKIVRRNSNTVLVEGKVRPGDRIVIEGVQRLRSGRKIKIAEDDKQAPAQSNDTSAARVN